MAKVTIAKIQEFIRAFIRRSPVVLMRIAQFADAILRNPKISTSLIE
jgi:hypothetical protein